MSEKKKIQERSLCKLKVNKSEKQNNVPENNVIYLLV